MDFGKCGKLNSWFPFYTLLLLMLCACGSGGASKALHIDLQIPQEYSKESFWLGVESNIIILKSSEGQQKAEVPWQDYSGIDISKGDKICFEGRDGKGQLLVAGEVIVGDENTLLLPVQRVL